MTNVPYHSPNFRVIDLLKALFIADTDAVKKIKNYFSRLTGKKYILITNSCRSALYLTYTVLSKRGDVITSPLTCKIALDTINESGNTSIFADINLGDLNIHPDDIQGRITKDTIAIQAIHLGGVSCNMEQILTIAQKKNLMVIEDCAQSLGAVFKGQPTGSFGNVACFSLIKNAYGIGGGVLATDDYEIYQKAKDINDELDKLPLWLFLFRVIRNLLDTKRTHKFFFFMHKYLMALRPGKVQCRSVHDQLRKISIMEKKVAAHQLDRLTHLHAKRVRNGKKLYNLMCRLGIIYNNDFDIDKASFTKLFVYNPAINSKKLIKQLSDIGIEAMHLEHRYGSPNQKKIVSTAKKVHSSLPNYFKVHDCLVSLPLYEEISEKNINLVINSLHKILDSQIK